MINIFNLCYVYHGVLIQLKSSSSLDILCSIPGSGSAKVLASSPGREKESRFYRKELTDKYSKIL